MSGGAIAQVGGVLHAQRGVFEDYRAVKFKNELAHFDFEWLSRQLFSSSPQAVSSTDLSGALTLCRIA